MNETVVALSVAKVMLCKTIGWNVDMFNLLLHNNRRLNRTLKVKITEACREFIFNSVPAKTVGSVEKKDAYIFHQVHAHLSCCAALLKRLMKSKMAPKHQCFFSSLT